MLVAFLCYNLILILVGSCPSDSVGFYCREKTMTCYNEPSEWSNFKTGGKHFGYGKNVVAATFVSPSLLISSKKGQFRGGGQVNRENVIVMLCLLLSGDVHQCPGPIRNNDKEDRSEFCIQREMCLNTAECTGRFHFGRHRLIF